MFVQSAVACSEPVSFDPPGTLFVITVLHVDTQWRWTVRDTIRHHLPDTVAKNLELFQRFPEYRVSFEGAFRYMLLEEHHPLLYMRLKEAIAAGRWVPVGGMLDAPDTNIPSPESLIRHILYGSRFFQQAFDHDSTDLFLPDVFGLSWAIPSIAAHCGITGLSHCKLLHDAEPQDLPFDIAAWQGPDGAVIAAAIAPGFYNLPLTEDPIDTPGHGERIEDRGTRTGSWFGIRYFGVGDIGGAPDEQSLQHLAAATGRPDGIRVVSAGADAPFRELSSERMDRLDSYTGELQLPTHGTGCWTSGARLKRWNRRLEQLADAAERAAVAAEHLGTAPYPAVALRDARLRYLWHQMHDDVTGTSIPDVVDITLRDYDLAWRRLRTILSHSMLAASTRMDTRAHGISVVCSTRSRDTARTSSRSPSRPASRRRSTGGPTVPTGRRCRVRPRARASQHRGYCSLPGYHRSALPSTMSVRRRLRGLSSRDSAHPRTGSGQSGTTPGWTKPATWRR